MKFGKIFGKKQKTKDLVYLITFFLAISWILVSITKSIINRDGVQRYNFIQRNTIGMWLLIFISLSISKYKFKNYITAIPILILLFIIHEILWYEAYIQITKDEGEVINNFYRWGNINLNTIKDIDNLSGTDLTEGYFNNNWNLSNKETLTLKYDTYYDYLKLEPGMKLLDIGCGNGFWINYCTKRGIKCTGITITKDQADFCKSKGLTNIIVGNVQNDILLTINEKFDAISAIGAVEHFSSRSQPKDIRIKHIKKYYEQVKNLIDPNSRSGRYLNSCMTLNLEYSNYKSLKWSANCYLVISAYGYAFAMPDKILTQTYSSSNSVIIIKRDYTEDYRWILVRDKNTWGWANYKLDSPYRVANFFRDVLTDPSWWQRYLYGYFNCWLWQFGGTNPKPMPENKDTPIRSYIYVTQIS